MRVEGLKGSYNIESASGFLRCALGVELQLLNFHSKRFLPAEPSWYPCALNFKVLVFLPQKKREMAGARDRTECPDLLSVRSGVCTWLTLVLRPLQVTWMEKIMLQREHWKMFSFENSCWAPFQAAWLTRSF